ncbi:hypothetical protein R6Q59_020561 [Mikania micrantha]
MRKGGRKMWWVKKSLRTESRMDIEQILKAKLETIKEESEVIEDTAASSMVCVTNHRMMKDKKLSYKKIAIMNAEFRPRISLKLKDSYLLFMSGFVSKRCLGVIPQC